MMELEVFPRPEVIRPLGDFVTVQLYTDVVPIKSIDPGGPAREPGRRQRSTERDQALQRQTTNPNYVVIDPDGNDPREESAARVPPAEFVGFLKSGLPRQVGKGSSKDRPVGARPDGRPSRLERGPPTRPSGLPRPLRRSPRPGRRPRPREVAGDRLGVVVGDDQDQADPHVEDAEHLGVGDLADRLEPGEDLRDVPRTLRRRRIAQPSGRIRGGLSISRRR